MTENMDATLMLREREARTSRLLRDCLALGEKAPRVPARKRLDEAIGRDLARLLVTSLTARSAR
jgi:hypothetical protein